MLNFPKEYILYKKIQCFTGHCCQKCDHFLIEHNNNLTTIGIV